MEEVKTMRRTQLYLDEARYQFLLNLAKKKRESIAQVVRELIDAFKEKKLTKRDSLFQVCGIAKDKTDVAENYEDYLYGDKK